MTRRVLLAGILGGVTFFVWGVVSWVVLPLHRASLKGIPDEDRVVQVLEDSRLRHGLYVFPAPPKRSAALGEEETEEERVWEEKAKRGPLGLIVYQPAGRPPGRMFRPMTQGLLLSVFAGFVAAFALSRAQLRNYGQRVLLVVVFGLFAWSLGPAQMWNWFQFPGDFTLAMLADTVVGWGIAGAVMAGIVKA
jgi:hypothetical protein